MYFYFYYYFIIFHVFEILTWSRRNIPVTFTRDSGCLARDEFLVREGYHMLIYIFVLFYCWALHYLDWAISGRELIRINSRITF